ncbi:transketolase C-terminal domain-containing protein [Akkermansia sp. JRP_AM1]|uniref:alpha-ketoacid dehydrogenase subunit beta n=1 Tax=Akkermansia sp. JRP_AM1 TaxID=3414159 RepID=UPI003BFA716C
MSVTYIDAIHDAQKDLLAEDKDVFLYGQDIGVFGGAFKATKGLKELFPDRVIDAPISEDAMAGMVTGAAVMGKKPIMEVQFADFSTIAFNQIVNMAATHYYRTGIPANITVRLPCGGTPGTGPFHSQSLEALFAHYPGLHVMTPATVADAYWMLRQAVEVPDPVIFLEHKFLYRWLKAEDNYREAPVIPFGMARIARTGKHATVVAYSAMVPEAVRAADLLAKESGYEVEVVDLRTVRPLDMDTVIASVARTGRVLVVGEDFPWGASRRKSFPASWRKASICWTLRPSGSTPGTPPSPSIPTCGRRTALRWNPSPPPSAIFYPSDSTQFPPCLKYPF